MADHTKKQKTPIKQGLDHREEALSLLGDIRPAAGIDEAIASAQVHAILALVQVQTDISHLLSMNTRELNASNMFKLAEILDKEHPLRSAIHNGLLSHLTKNGAVNTDVLLAARIKELGLEIKKGDDILVTNSAGTESHSLIVMDPDKDVWLLLTEDDSVLDSTIDTPRLHSLFKESIGSLTITLKETPTE